jgi:hypothetical protein
MSFYKSMYYRHCGRESLARVRRNPEATDGTLEHIPVTGFQHPCWNDDLKL